MSVSQSSPALSERRWTVRLAVGLALAALLLHVPGLVERLFNSDEASLATMAMEIERGGTLYHQTADRKPPVVPYVYALVFDLTGRRDIRPVRAVGSLVLAGTALLLALEAKRRTGSRTAAVAAGVFLLAGTVANFPADSQAAGFELFMLLPMTAAVVAAGRGQAVLAGVGLALACLCKQTAIVTALPVAFLLFRASGWRPVARAAVAASALVAATAVAFGPREFLLWTVTGNGGYLALRGSLLASVLRGLGMTSAFVALNAVLIWCCVVARRRGPVDWDLWLWLAGSAVAVVAGFRFFGHYYLQLVPPLALIGATGLPTASRLWRWAAAGLVLPVAGMWVFSFSPPNARGIIPYRDVADRVRVLTTPADRIFVWGEYPEIYWAANREPATRFIHTGFLTGNSGGRDAAAVRESDGVPGAWDFLAADIAATPPELIVDTSSASIRRSDLHPLEKTFLWDEVVRHYRLVDVVDGVRLFQRVTL
ncbi:MAG: hypothetical protein QOG43_252 [Actinomycetota bacterium]|jgi:hypothetical protein|nr:hypothetical protein [Actinomycetota bacterium]